MGLAVALLKATCFMMEKAKAVVLTIGANYQDNFNNKFTEIIQMRDKAIKDNSSIYFERETPIDQLPKPDCQNFVKMEAVLETLNTKLPIEDKLRHIVPPEVRAMQNELKNQIQDLINQQYEKEAKGETEIRQFLGNFGLPQALHALTSTNEIPKQIWEKIEEFQKKGGSQNIKGIIQGIQQLNANNDNLMQQMMTVLEEEEKSDNQMRTQFGNRWNRLPSSSLNQQFKFVISDFAQKKLAASETDRKIEEKFKSQGEASLAILNKSKNELNALIPQSQIAKEISQNPVIVAVKQSLEQLDQNKEARSKILEEAVQKCQNFNGIESLIQVHTKTAEKGTVFEKLKDEFRQVFSQLEPLDKQAAELKGII